MSTSPYPALSLNACNRRAAKVSDEDLIRAVAAGQQEEIAVLFDRLGRLVFSVAKRILRDETEAEDVVQLVFLDVLRFADRFDATRGTARVWLLQYAYHRSMRRKQQLSRLQGAEHLDGVISEMMRYSAPHANFNLSREEAARFVEQALALLNAKQRTTIELTFFECWTAEETARQTAQAAVTVRHHLYRGLAKLRTLMESRVAFARAADRRQSRKES